MSIRKKHCLFMADRTRYSCVEKETKIFPFRQRQVSINELMLFSMTYIGKPN